MCKFHTEQTGPDNPTMEEQKQLKQYKRISHRMHKSNSNQTSSPIMKCRQRFSKEIKLQIY